MFILLLNSHRHSIHTLLTTHSILMVLWENENFLTSNLLCFLTSVKLCPLVILLSLISKKNIRINIFITIQCFPVGERGLLEPWGTLNQGACSQKYLLISHQMAMVATPGLLKLNHNECNHLPFVSSLQLLTFHANCSW